MIVADIIALVKGVIQFPTVILEFIKILKNTPQENHEDVLKKAREESSRFAETGRPSWD